MGHGGLVSLVLGIDPSYAAVGWAICTPKHEVADTGSISFKGKEPAEQKLPSIVREVDDLFHGLEGDFVVAIEQAWLGKNFQTANKLAELRGAIIGLALAHSWTVQRVTPKEWQSSASIPVRCKREEVKTLSIGMAQLRAPRKCMTEDEADAINIAWHVAGVLRMRGAT